MGLSSDEAERRLRSDGPNALPEPPAPGILTHLLEQARDPLTLALAAAGILSISILQDVLEGITILAIVAINVAVSVAQQVRADTALAALKRLASPVARVERDGEVQEMEARLIVMGDVVHVAAGDRVPADVEWTQAHGASADESLLTGESLPVRKESGDAGYAGTLLVRGRAVGTVTSTGARTRMGAIATGLGGSPPAPLEQQLQTAAFRIGIAAFVAAILLGGIVILRLGADAWGEAILAAVALAVAAIPEGLVAVVTLALAVGVRRMARQGAIVRHLKAIETLGAANVLCVDKTGTLTEGRLALTQAVAVPGREGELWDAALRCNDAGEDSGDPIDVAIREGAKQAGHPEPPGKRQSEVPFDAELRAMWTVHETPSGPRLSVKGAPETVAAMCRPGTELDQIMEAAQDAFANGARVLAVAGLDTDDLDAKDLLPLGILAFSDPVRLTAAAAIRDCRAGGAVVVMVTGDHPKTAAAVASAVGLEPKVVSGVELADMTAQRRAGALAAAHVVARVEPETKVELVEAHRARGHTVAMMGDGVNDAPALRKADIGVAVAGSGGTDVAREAADIVLTSGDLGVLATAVREGRRIYENLVAVVSYLLAGNASEVIVVLLGAFLFPELVVILAPVQLLWINLITDGPPALALATDRTPGDPLHRPARAAGEQLLGWSRFRTLLVRGGVVAAAVLGTVWWAKSRGASPQEWQSQAFLSLILCHLVLGYISRAGGPWQRGWARNRVLLATFGISILLQAVVLEIPLLRALFGLAPVDGWAYVAATIAAVAILAADAIWRALAKPRGHGDAKPDQPGP